MVFLKEKRDFLKKIKQEQTINTFQILIKYTLLLTAINLDCISCNNTKYIDFLFSEDSSCSLHSKDMNLYEYYERRMKNDLYVLCHGIHLYENNQIKCSMPDNEVEHRKLRVIRMNYFDLEKYKFTYIETLIEKSHASVIPIYLNRRIRMENFLVFKNSLVCEDFHPIFFFIKYTEFYEILGLLNHLNGYKYDNIRSIYRKIVEYGLLRPFSREILDDNLNLKFIYLKNTKKSFYILLKVLFDECDFDIEIIKNRFYILEFKTLYCDVIETFEHNSLQLYLKDIFLCRLCKAGSSILKVFFWFLDFYDISSILIYGNENDMKWYMERLGPPYYNQQYLKDLEKLRNQSESESVSFLGNSNYLCLPVYHSGVTNQNIRIDAFNQKMGKIERIILEDLIIMDIYQPIVESFKTILPNVNDLFLCNVEIYFCILSNLIKSDIEYIQFHFCKFIVPYCYDLKNYNYLSPGIPKKISLSTLNILPEVFDVLIHSKNIYCLILQYVNNISECFNKKLGLKSNIYESLVVLKMSEICFSEIECKFISNFSNLQKLTLKYPENGIDSLYLDSLNLCLLSHSLITLKFQGFKNLTLRILEPLKSLQYLYIRNCAIVDFSFSDYSSLKQNLIHLDLSHTKIKDKQNLNLLSNCLNLCELKLSYCGLKECDFFFLKSVNLQKTITEFHLNGNETNSKVLLEFFEYKNIHTLVISLKKTPHSTFSVLKNCKFTTNLKFLFLYDAILNDQDMKTIFSFTELECLTLEDCKIIEESSKVLLFLPQLPSLKTFEIIDLIITDYDKNILLGFYETAILDQI
ncbi:hypothetical protein CWI38_0516p0010 [Hamiltosporidium tvaerminnensis]|uniref:Uncharacterized protein n=1 Tax=Hamiltosporidium tvaerminnensis TaxID=1176355 RepID=A0A4Q9LWN0_9MICR|nr:hypothetical protein CWI38_0516p0010 [Hamiltosporidium tvaerminnensis]